MSSKGSLKINKPRWSGVIRITRIARVQTVQGSDCSIALFDRDTWICFRIGRRRYQKTKIAQFVRLSLLRIQLWTAIRKVVRKHEKDVCLLLKIRPCTHFDIWPCERYIFQNARKSTFSKATDVDRSYIFGCILLYIYVIEWCNDFLWKQ